jgi:hypothetical protein
MPDGERKRRAGQRVAGQQPHGSPDSAVIAIWAQGKETGTSLPSNAEFERELDLVPSPSSYKRAKNLLVRLGALGTGNGPYYVA